MEARRLLEAGGGVVSVGSVDVGLEVGRQEMRGKARTKIAGIVQK